MTNAILFIGGMLAAVCLPGAPQNQAAGQNDFSHVVQIKSTWADFNESEISFSEVRWMVLDIERRDTSDITGLTRAIVATPKRLAPVKFGSPISGHRRGENTIPGHQSHWRTFYTSCEPHSLCPLPASAETIASISPKVPVG